MERRLALAMTMTTRIDVLDHLERASGVRGTWKRAEVKLVSHFIAAVGSDAGDGQRVSGDRGPSALVTFAGSRTAGYTSCVLVSLADALFRDR